MLLVENIPETLSNSFRRALNGLPHPGGTLNGDQVICTPRVRVRWRSEEGIRHSHPVCKRETFRLYGGEVIYLLHSTQLPLEPWSALTYVCANACEEGEQAQEKALARG